MGITEAYKTFSGSDAVCYAHFKGCKPIMLGQATTCSYSIRRNTTPVNVLGKIKIRGYTKGAAFVAGTIFFSMINHNIVKEFEKALSEIAEMTGEKWRLDELPPFNLIIIASNEYGAVIHMVIDNITFTDEAGVISVNDIITESQTSYLARNVKPFESFDYLIGKGIEEDFQFSNDSEISNSLNNYGVEDKDFTSAPKEGTSLDYAFDFYNITYNKVADAIIGFKSAADGILKEIPINVDDLGVLGLGLKTGLTVRDAIFDMANIVIRDTGKFLQGIFDSAVDAVTGNSPKIMAFSDMLSSEEETRKQVFLQHLTENGLYFLLKEDKITY